MSWKKYIDMGTFLEKIRKFEGVFIVEGKRDKKALVKLGLRNIVAINGKSLVDVVEEVLGKGEEVAILTDFDKEGKEKATKLIKLLSKHRIKVNSSIRKEFVKLGVKKIEDISSLMEDDYLGQNSTLNDKIFNRSRVRNKWNRGKT